MREQLPPLIAGAALLRKCRSAVCVYRGFPHLFPCGQLQLFIAGADIYIVKAAFTVASVEQLDICRNSLAAVPDIAHAAGRSKTLRIGDCARSFIGAVIAELLVKSRKLLVRECADRLSRSDYAVGCVVSSIFNCIDLCRIDAVILLTDIYADIHVLPARILERTRKQRSYEDILGGIPAQRNVYISVVSVSSHALDCARYPSEAPVRGSSHVVKEAVHCARLRHKKYAQHYRSRDSCPFQEAAFPAPAGDDFEVSYNIFVVFCSGREGRKNPCRYRIKTIDVLCELVHLVAEELLRACISVFHIIHLPFPVVWLSPFYSVISPWIRGFSLYELSP